MMPNNIAKNVGVIEVCLVAVYIYVFYASSSLCDVYIFESGCS